MKCGGNAAQIRMEELGVAGVSHRQAGRFYSFGRVARRCSFGSRVVTRDLTLPFLELDAILIVWKKKINYVFVYLFSSFENTKKKACVQWMEHGM